MELKVGQDVVSMCGKCKEATHHVVFAVAEGRKARVQCKVCQAYHNYRPPKTAVDTVAKVRAKLSAAGATGGKTGKTATKKTATGKEPKKRASRAKKEVEPDWEAEWTTAMQGKDPSAMVDYRPKENFEESQVLNHQSFGVGVVTSVSPEFRMKVLFQAGPKTLVCGRALIQRSSAS